MDPARLARELDEFLVSSPHACVIEEGEILFDFSVARYSISGEHGKCLLHLWSPERNMVRRIVDIEHKAQQLRLAVQRLGKGKPTWLDVVSSRERRAPTVQRQARLAYQRWLQRVLERSFPEWGVQDITSSADLEHSLSSVYCRGLLRRGHSRICFLGVNDSELQASIDGALTFALLWLDFCRRRESERGVVECLRVFVPRGRSAVVHARMHWLDRQAARFELYEFDERAEELFHIDISDQGNIATRLVRCADNAKACQRFAASIARVRAAVPECETVVLSSSELAFRLHGLEFARAQVATSESFTFGEQIVFGSCAHETVLSPESEPLFLELMQRVRRDRGPDGDRRSPLWRMQPERWLESQTKRNVSALDARLDPAQVYAQVPAFAASDRGMIDLLARTHDGRLAVLELKADEDIHLPLQGVDYWSRVKWHHQREEFHGFGYFVDSEGHTRALSHEPPLLLLVAPALHIHPATDTLLRFLSHEIDWTLIAVDEHWREEIKVVFRKRRSQLAAGLG
ncbi:MAG: hypothetical protein JOZ44_13750 [Acidobacteria bacterium]|nr:hypothetical protein [Acidobacteriota bacterium]